MEIEQFFEDFVGFTPPRYKFTSPIFPQLKLFLSNFVLPALLLFFLDLKETPIYSPRKNKIPEMSLKSGLEIWSPYFSMIFQGQISNHAYQMVRLKIKLFGNPGKREKSLKNGK